MKTFIFIALTSLTTTTFAKQYLGKLNCWDNNNPNALIPSYIEQTLNSEDYVDQNNHRSFVMDFSTPTERWSFERRGFKVHYEWSISECEDRSKFVFRRIDLNKVLKGELNTTNVKYFYYHPDGHVIFRVLKCEKTESEIPSNAPVFKLF